MDIGRVNTTTLPDKLLNVFPDHARVDLVNNPERAQKPVYPYLWGGMNDKRVYHPEETTRMFGTLRSIYLRTANQLAAEGNIEKAEQIHDKHLEIFDPEVIPHILLGSPPHIHYAVMQAGALLRLGTPTATEKGLKMTSQMLDEFKETFDWFEKGDERTLAIQAGNIDLCVRYLTYLESQLTEEQRLLLNDRFEQINLTRSVTSLAAQISTEFDFYLKKGLEAQQQLINKLAELNGLIDAAVLTNDRVLEDNIARLMESKINMIAAIDPQAGRAFRDYFLSEEPEI